MAFKTKVVRDPQANQIIWSEVVKILPSQHPKADQGAYPVGSNLVDLAKQTTQSLGASGAGPVHLRIGDTLFAGPSISADWRYVPDSVVLADQRIVG
ncbi:MAG: hypothetical protein R2709_01060 [Marmoricola sp.]